jgi:hypothetical protein
MWLFLLACAEPEPEVETSPCDGDGWTSVGELQPPGSLGAVVAVEGGWLHVGGSGGVPQSGVRFSSDGLGWSRVATLPYGVQDAVLHAEGDAVWILGGSAGFFAATYDTVLRSDDGGVSWTEEDPLPAPLAAAGWIPMEEGGGILVGGMSDMSTLTPTAAVWRVTRDGDAWRYTEMDGLPAARGWPAVARLGDRVVALGGFDQGSQDSVFELSLTAGTWTSVEPLPVPVDRGRAVATEAGVLLIGGETRTDVLDTTFVGSGNPLSFESGVPLPGPRSGGEVWLQDGAVHYARGFTTEPEGPDLTEILRLCIP